MIEYDFGSGTEGAAESKPESKAEPRPDASAQWSLIIYSLLKSRRLAINCGILGAIMGFVQGALQQNVYQSSGKLLVRPGMREASTAEVDPMGGGIRTASSSTSEAVTTELHLLGNPRLFRDVARKVGAREVLKMRDPTKDDGPRTPAPTRLLHEFQAWWFGLEESDEQLEKDAEVPEFLVYAAGNVIKSRLRSVAGFGSPVIDVAYKGQTPDIARKVVDTFLDQAAIHHRNIFTSDPQLKFLEDQREKLEQASDEANEAFTEFKIKHEIYHLESQKGHVLSDINDLEKKIATERLQRISLLSNLKFLENAIELEDPEKLPNREMAPNPDFSRIKADLRTVRREKIEFAQRPNETPDQVNGRRKYIEDEIRRLESELEQTEQFLPVDNPRYTQLINQRDVINGQLAALDGGKEEQLLQLEAYKKRRDVLQAAEAEYMRLMLKVDQALAAVDANHTGVQQLAVMNLLDKEELGNLRILQHATETEMKISPDRARVLKMGGMMGVAIGVMLAFIRGLLDPLLRRPGEMPGLGGGKVLSVVKDLGRKYQVPGKVALVGNSDWARVTNGLWAHLTALGAKPGSSLVAFTALLRGAGVSSFASCAGMGLALRLQERVLIIETDFENPGLAECLELEQGAGLSSVLAGEVEAEDAIQRTKIPGLEILDAGRGGHPGPGWFASERAQQLIQTVRSKYKFILLDLAPATIDPESRLLLWKADALIPVAAAGKTRKSELKQYLRGLRESEVPILGSVVNRYRTARPFWLPGKDGELVVAQPVATATGTTI